MSIENNEQNEELEQEEEIIETPPAEPDKRLVDMVNRLKKLANIDEAKLEGKTLDEQYNLLSFLVDNAPKTKKVNKPVLPGITQDSQEYKGYNLKYKTPDKMGWTIDIFKTIKNKG